MLVGANGSGKSTIIEALAAVWARRVTAFRSDFAQQALGQPSAEDSDLHIALRLHYTPGGPTGGLFVRAERLHSQAPTLTPPSGRGRWAEPGGYVLDEPESALSFDSSLVLLALMNDMRAAGTQIVLATHSPVLAALPDAHLLELGDQGVHPVDYNNSDLVTSWRSFLARPDRYLRHLT